MDDNSNNSNREIQTKLDIAKKYGIYFEDMRWTKTWLHCQIVAPKSGKRIYIPSNQPAIDPTAWSGIYPSEFDQ